MPPMLLFVIIGFLMWGYQMEHQYDMSSYQYAKKQKKETAEKTEKERRQKPTTKGDFVKAKVAAARK